MSIPLASRAQAHEHNQRLPDAALATLQGALLPAHWSMLAGRSATCCAQVCIAGYAVRKCMVSSPTMLLAALWRRVHSAVKTCEYTPPSSSLYPGHHMNCMRTTAKHSHSVSRAELAYIFSHSDVAGLRKQPTSPAYAPTGAKARHAASKLMSMQHAARSF